MDVSVIITCWNGRKLLEKNLPQVIRASKNPKNRIIEIIVIDDASGDDSVEFLENNFPDIKIVKHAKNTGYSSVCNSGFKNAKGDLVAILNTDVIPSLDFLEAALTSFDDSRVFAVSFNEGKYGPGKLEWKKGFLQIKSTTPTKETTLSSWANGGSSIFRKNIWNGLGGMDERFLPFYFEDVDLGIRAFKSGFKCLWEPNSSVIHEHEGTINSNNFNMDYINSIKERNQLLLVWKNIDSFILFSSHMIFLVKRCITHPGYLKIIFMAIPKIFTKANNTILKRKISTLEFLKICESIG